MFKTGVVSALFLFSSIAMQTAFAEDKSVALVNGVSIPQSRIDMRVKAAVAQGQADTPELRKAVREDMINLEVMSQAAKKSGLDKHPDVVQQTELARQSVLVSAFVQDYLKKNPISEAQYQKEYDSLTSDMGDKQYKARHILVDSEAEARAIIAKLDKNTKFADLASQSKDTGSAENGGELDWAVPANFVPPFAAALSKLKKGEYTQVPVESQFGWHVIKLDDVRNLEVPPLEQVKPQIQQRLQQLTIQNAISEMRGKAKIE